MLLAIGDQNPRRRFSKQGAIRRNLDEADVLRPGAQKANAQWLLQGNQIARLTERHDRPLGQKRVALGIERGDVVDRLVPRVASPVLI